ncbi:MAG TPA: hypothetical protein VK996_16225 [Ramlibacter sp.]|nr:hypothetical protein [Ramlibacter sp.]
MIITKTLEGQRVLKDRSVPLTAHQRSAFILVDGKRSIEDLLAVTKAAGVTRADIDRLMELGLVAELSKSAAIALDKATQLEAKRHARPLEERYERAHPVAAMLTSHLGLRGRNLNFEVMSAMNYMDLLALAPRIREAVGEEKFAMLDRLLNE